MSGNTFEESVLLKELHHYLPSQTPLKDFIHHNTLHAFQHKRFYEGIFDASAIFGYHVTLELDEYRNLVKTGRIKKDVLYRVIELKKGSDNKEAWLRKMQFHDYDLQKESRINKLRSIWNNYYHIDLNNKVQPLLFRILAAYLDQGISNWNFPVTTKGFLDALRIVEKNSYVSFFHSERAKELFFSESLTLSDLLKILVGQENLYNQYIFDQQFAHRGWAGMVATIESRPDTLFEKRSITLRDLIHFELLLEIDILDDNLEGKWQPISQLEKIDPIDLFAKIEYSELQDVLELFQDAFEWSYYDAVLGAFVYDNAGEKTRHQIPKFQAVFCIDERECSLRRHLEFVEPHCETFGAPGFFGVEFYFQPEHAKFYEKLCPAPVTPKFLIKEEGKLEKRKHELLYHKEAHSLFGGFLFSLLAGWLSLVQLVLHLFQPKMSPAISNAFSHVGEESLLTIENLDPEDREKGLQIGFNIEEMTQRIKAQLSNMGMVKDFAPLVYIVAHGSSSANNPHHGAHDCGACSGRPGSVNARVFSFMANHKEVRVRLAKTGIEIPDSTRFVGALHDTAADEIRFFDISELDAENKERHQENILHFETA
ncbi:MAG TPA: Na-translocating system protein MpsB, partial [Sediminibacterium sp.]|nr:Na-translocating system protein MpsB [Sediminibacterium sp.]